MRKRIAAVVLLSAICAACGSAKPQIPESEPSDHRRIAEGYALLYGITSRQQHVGKLMLIKQESDPVDQFITELAKTVGEINAEIEDMAKRYPALTINKQFLPDVEVMSRESFEEETKKAFMDSSGHLFERRLLLTQRSALEHEQHIAKVMVGLESGTERREFWVRTDKRFGELRSKLERLLERSYFR
jgi:hypothetical protein